MSKSVRRIVVLGAAIAFLGTDSFVRANTLVLNGGFETPLVGPGFVTVPEGSSALTDWTISKSSINVSTTSIDHIGGYWDPHSGLQSIDLDGSPGGADQSAKISQDLTGAQALVDHAQYELSFWLAGNPDGAPPVKTVLVSVGDHSQVFTFNASSQTRHGSPGMGWTYESFFFTAGATNTLSFDSSTPGWYGPALDDVKIVPVPLPATASMGIVLLGSLAGFGAIRKIKVNRETALA